MGAYIYLKSIHEPFAADERNFPDVGEPRRPVDPAMLNAMFEKLMESGGYLRNGYNSGDITWVMGSSWSETVGRLLDATKHLPIERARELVARLEATPFTDELLGKVYLEKLTNGVEPHPVSQMLAQVIPDEQKPKKVLPPDFDHWARFVRRRRELFLALPHKSIAMGEPLGCDL